MSIEFSDGSTKLIGFYTTSGPIGYIEGKQRDDVLRFSAKLIRSWPNTFAKKPYRDRKGNWIIRVKIK